ncbi:MAG: hypothetical protein HYU66_22120 [Armatimonadetes bacterium]|nr:hypothetical protein [Armatimonadota bacterium]
MTWPERPRCTVKGLLMLLLAAGALAGAWEVWYLWAELGHVYFVDLTGGPATWGRAVRGVAVIYGAPVLFLCIMAVAERIGGGNRQVARDDRTERAPDDAAGTGARDGAVEAVLRDAGRTGDLPVAPTGVWVPYAVAALVAVGLPFALSWVSSAALAPLLASLAPQVFPTPSDVPLAACHLVRMQLVYGLGTLAVLCACLARASSARRAPSPGLLFLGCLALFAGLATHSSQIQSLTGDEPHYLLAARSLAYDRDAVLDNDYGERLYSEFYPTDLLRRALGAKGEKELDPHAVPGRQGEARPVHLLGLSLLILPGYLLAGWQGAVGTAVLIGALTAWLAVRLALAVPGCDSLPCEAGEGRGGGRPAGGDGDPAPLPSSPRFAGGGGAVGDEPRGWAWFGGLSVALLSPLLAYSSSLHCEPAAAACLAGLAWLAVVTPPESPRPRLLAALALALLPWLHVKFLLPELLLCAWLVSDARRAGVRGAWWPAVGLAIGLLTQAASFGWMYGSPWPNAPQLHGAGKFPGAFSGNPLVGLPGLLFDQQDGLFWVWPVGLLAVPGAVLAWRERWARRLLALIGLHVLLIATYRIWRSGFAPAGRQLLPVLPLLAPFIGVGGAWLAARRRGLLRGLVGLNAVLVALYAWLPRLRYPGMDGDLTRHPVLARLHQPWLDVLLPCTDAGAAAKVVAGVYLLAVTAWAVSIARRGGEGRSR